MVSGYCGNDWRVHVHQRSQVHGSIAERMDELIRSESTSHSPPASRAMPGSVGYELLDCGHGIAPHGDLLPRIREAAERSLSSWRPTSFPPRSSRGIADRAAARPPSVRSVVSRAMAGDAGAHPRSRLRRTPRRRPGRREPAARCSS